MVKNMDGLWYQEVNNWNIDSDISSYLILDQSLILSEYLFSHVYSRVNNSYPSDMLGELRNEIPRLKCLS